MVYRIRRHVFLSGIVKIVSQKSSLSSGVTSRVTKVLRVQVGQTEARRRTRSHVHLILKTKYENYYISLAYVLWNCEKKI